jgi:hypothetical protein
MVARYDFSIKQGADVDFTVQVWADALHTVIQNITSWTAKMQIRESPGSTLIQELTHIAGLTINGPAGQVTVHIEGSVTAGYTWTVAKYDLFVFGPGNDPAECVLEGDITVNPRITQ